MSVPAITVNKVCLSGLAAVAYADQLIRAGECDIVVAGGMESMTSAPHLLLASRGGYKYGDVTLIDSMAHDGLEDVFTDQAMGSLTESCNTGESLATLPPAFSNHGSITAGSSSPISDGAAAVVVASKPVAERLGLSVIAEIGAYGQVAGPDSSLQLQPSNAITLACKKEQIEVADLDLIEINEAFAAVGVASARALGLSTTEIEERVNVNGGAIALGHPIGASGARLVLTLALGLRRRGGGTGVAALCGGGGQGDAL